MRTQANKARVFRALHERNSAFLNPNPWDVGTARLLAHLGFEALATTSAGYAFSVGQRDNTIGRDKMMAHAGAIVSATDLPGRRTTSSADPTSRIRSGVFRPIKKREPMSSMHRAWRARTISPSWSDPS